MNQIPKNLKEINDRVAEINRGEIGGKMLIRIYYCSSKIDEMYADDINIQDDIYVVIKNKKAIALIPKTYYIEIVEK